MVFDSCVLRKEDQQSGKKKKVVNTDFQAVVIFSLEEPFKLLFFEIYLQTAHSPCSVELISQKKKANI